MQGRRFAAAGGPAGGEFQLNTYTTSDQRFPAVALGASGQFVAVWTSDGSAGSDSSTGSVQGQRFSVLVFADAFESGDTSAWSATVP